VYLVTAQNHEVYQVLIKKRTFAKKRR
jgi:hypothetical protein